MNLGTNSLARDDLRTFLSGLVSRFNSDQKFSNTDSLFLSGCLDSFAAMQLVMHLEDAYGIDFSMVDFDLAKLDSIDAIMNFIVSAPQVK